MYKISILVNMQKNNKNKFKTLDSLINQKFKDFEIVCISKLDESDEKELTEYISKYPNISIKKDINEAINTANGEYTVITNLNVFFEDTWAQKVYDYAKIDNEDMIICDLDIEDFQGNNIKSYSYESIEKNKSRIVILNWYLCNILFKTEKIKNIKLKSNNTYNELLFIFEAMKRCEKIGYAQDVKCYLYTKKNEFNNIELKNIDELKEVLKEIKRKYKENNQYNIRIKNILSAVAFSELGVESLIKLNEKRDSQIDIKSTIKDTMNFLDTNFFEWRNNPILKSSFMKKEKPHIWYAYVMYKYGYTNLYLKINSFLNQK